MVVEYFLLSGALIGTSVVTGLFAVRLLLRRLLLFTSVTLLAIIGMDSFGLALMPFLSWSLPYTDAKIMYTMNTELPVYTRHVVAHILTQLILFGIILVGLFSSKKPSTLKAHGLVGVPSVVAPPLVALSMVWIAYFYFTYFIKGPGLSLLMDFSLSYDSPETAVTARSLAASEVERGQGAYGALIAAYVLLPYLVALSALLVKRHSLFFLCWVSGFTLSLVYGLQTYQKAPVAVSVLVYGALLLLRFQKDDFLAYRHMLGKLPVIATLGGAAGIALYVINFGLNAIDAIWAFIARIFLVPPNTEGYWFAVYPALLPFNGFRKIFLVDMDIIRNVAYVSTGDVFSANASFIAIGWSGAGFLGVLLVAVLLGGYSLSLDLLCQKRPMFLKVVCLVVVIPPLFMLVSGSITDYLSKGGLVPLLLALSIKARNLPQGGEQ